MASGTVTVWDARVVVANGPPEDLAEAGQRIDDVRNRMGEIDHESRAAIARVRTDLGLGLDRESKVRAAALLKLATEGVRMGLLGLGLVVVGTILQIAASCLVLAGA